MKGHNKYMLDNIGKAIEKVKEYNNAQCIYIYFNPLDVEYLSEYFNMEVNIDKRTKVDNCILIPYILSEEGNILIGSEDIFRIKEIILEADEDGWIRKVIEW